MSELNLMVHNIESSVDDIKLCLLYYDKITLSLYDRNTYVADQLLAAQPHLNLDKYFTNFKQQGFDDQISSLKDIGVIETVFEPYNNPEQDEKILVDNELHNLSYFTDSNRRLFFKEDYIEFNDSERIGHSGTLTEEAYHVFENLEMRRIKKYREPGENIIGSPLFFAEYYGYLLRLVLHKLNNGVKVLNTSQALDKLLKLYFTRQDFIDVKNRIDKEIDISPNIVFESIKLAVPNVSKLPFDDILVLKMKINDELLEFKNYLLDLEITLLSGYTETEKVLRAKEIVNMKVAPSLSNLSRKLTDTKINIPTTLLRELKDPKSYSPLLLSFTDNISNTMAILISAGMVSFNTAMDYYRSNKDLKSSGLYYLLKLKTI